MSKPNDQILMFPGEAGWEVWTSRAGEGFALHAASGQGQAGEVDDLPAGDVLMAFAARSLTSVPVRVMTDDPALYEDLVALHAERLGLKSDPMGGQLSDWFVVESAAEGSVLLSVFLNAPGEGGLPQRSPSAFDVSARCLQVEGNALCLWRELGRWVFAVYEHGRLAFCQATTVDSVEPGDALVRELKLSLMQLTIQGLKVEPARIEVFTATGEADVARLKAEFSLPVHPLVRPLPVWPESPSRLLPEDVRAARHQAQRRRAVKLGIAAVAALYVGLIGWLGFGLWSDAAQVKRINQMALEAAPEVEAYALHKAKWNELQQAINTDYNPVELLHRVARCIPGAGSLHLERADITAFSITLRGDAPKFETERRFSGNLNKDSGLKRFNWSTPEGEENTRGWKFTYRATVVESEATP